MSPDQSSRKPADEEEDWSSHPARRALDQRNFQHIVEQRIAQAEAEGRFQNLPGAGKPLNLYDDAHTPEEDRTGFRMLKNAGFAPGWIELQKTIREDRGRLDAWLKRANARWEQSGLQERQRLQNEYGQQLRDLSRLIDHYNFSAPATVDRLPGLVIKEELKRLGT